MTTATKPPPSPHRTDWDAYYRKPFVATKVTRNFTENALVRLIRKYGPTPPFELVEIGGANSCFFNRIEAEFHPSRYHVFDLNQFGLDRMAERLGQRDDVVYHHGDVLGTGPDVKVPVVFSVGLIEHFSPKDTARAIDAHFDLLSPGGIAIISFPTPTVPYRLCRGAAEALGMWIFHDERPLRQPEVDRALSARADILHHEIVWPIVLTQMFVVARKR